MNSNNLIKIPRKIIIERIFPISKMDTCQNENNVNYTRSSTHAYLDYRRRMQNRLANLNNNVTNMIKESFSGIDDICQRVRECLFSVQTNQRGNTVNFTEYPSEYELVEERSKSADETAQINDDATDLSITEPLDNDETLSEKKPAPAPFVTVISCNDKGDSIENNPPQKKAIDEKTDMVNNVESILEEGFAMLENIRETVLSNVVATSYTDVDEMNQIIEDISEKIKNFSQATLISAQSCEEKSDDKKAVVKRPVLNPKFKKPPQRRPVTSPPKVKYTTLDANLSENELDCLLFERKPTDPFIMPDVYRKRAFTDLYQRLMAQLEANDSLILFQRLMTRGKGRNRKAQNSFHQTNSRLLDVPLVTYYPKKTKSNPSVKASLKKLGENKKYADSLWFAPFKGKGSAKKLPLKKSKRAIVKTPISRSIKSLNQNLGQRNQRMKTKRPSTGKTNKKSITVNSLTTVDNKRCPLECTCKMVVHNDQPLSPSTKCRLQWMRAKTSLASPRRKLEFLDILDDLTNKDLLPLQSEYPRRDNPPALLEQKDIHTTYLYKMMYGKQSAKTVWKQLLEPTGEGRERVSTLNRLTSAPIKDAQNEGKDKEKFNIQKYSRHEIIKKLSPYMYDPERKERYYQSVTVMPVQVYYDNYKPIDTPTKLHARNAFSPKKSQPSKEIKGFKRAMKVVFDSLPKKLEVPPLALAPTKPSAVSARPTIEKGILRNAASKSLSPRSFAPFCHGPHQEHPMAQRIHVEIKENSSKAAKMNPDMEKIKLEVQGRNLSSAERKLWANKYQKTIGQQLVSYIEHQDPVKPPAVPHHAVPKYKEPQVAETNNLSPTKDPNIQKHVLFNMQGLKQKNSAIQNNIQKAIDVIETKMVDILSTEGETTNVAAFDAMEKEITSVLTMMKSNKKKGVKATSSKSSNKVSKDDEKAEISFEEEFNSISDELFKRLEKILDSERSSENISYYESTAKSNQVPKKQESKQMSKDESKHVPKKEENKPPPKKENKAQKPGSSRPCKSNSKTLSLAKSPALDASSTTDTSKTASQPIKVNATSASYSPSKTSRRPREKTEKKSKLSTPTSAKTSLRSPGNTWGHILSMPGGDQNIEKSKPDQETGAKREDSADGKVLETENEVTHLHDNLIVENSQGDGANNTVSDPKNDENMANDDENPSKKVRFEEFLKEDTSKYDDFTLTSENISAGETKDDVSSNYFTPTQSPNFSPKSDLLTNKNSGTCFAEQVNKIIKRVEDIYTQLDDMQNSSSEENIKKFKDNVPEVRSEVFLTPFMQAVKEKRKTPENPNTQKSPSYYNVINFLDSLKEIQNEKPVEMHTARLCYHVNVYHQPMVYDQAKIEHTTEYLPPIQAKPSCIKKADEDYKSKQKKVSFLVAKENKGMQVTVCPFHRQKVLRISSEQFPPLEMRNSNSYTSNETNTEEQTHNEVKDKSSATESTEAQPEEVPRTGGGEENRQINIGDISFEAGKTTNTNKEQDDFGACNKLEESENIPSESQRGKEDMDDYEEINDKQAQVYCHTITLDDADQEDEWNIPERCNLSDRNFTTLGVDSREKKNDTSMSKLDKSIQSFHQAHKESYTTDESVKGVNTDNTCNEKAINTDQMDTSLSTANDYSNEDSLASLFCDRSGETLYPKVVKEHIDLHDENYAENPLVHVNSSLQKLKQSKIVVFREISDTPNLLRPSTSFPMKLSKKRMGKRRDLRLVRKASADALERIPKDIRDWGENVVILKSFYAIVYILMFTALSLDYRCM